MIPWKEGKDSVAMLDNVSPNKNRQLTEKRTPSYS